jgi:hypothetical protein
MKGTKTASVSILATSLLLTSTYALADAGSTLADIRKVIDRQYHSPTDPSPKKNINIYQFGAQYPLPQMSKDGQLTTIDIASGWLIVMNNATHTDHFEAPADELMARIYRGTQNDNSCINNNNAETADRTKQTWKIETLTSALATQLGYGKFPDIMFNVNYFDVRPQANFTTWQSNKCADPLGVIYDNHPETKTHNTYRNDKYLAGLPSYIQSNGTLNPLQTLVVHDSQSNASGPGWLQSTEIRLIENSDSTAAETEKVLDSITASDSQYVAAFTGVELLPKTNATEIDSGDGADAGAKATTRIAIGYNKDKDQLMIFEGGGYKTGGVTRENLAQLFRALGATLALETDGGGSASVAVRKDHVTWGGLSNSAPTSPCNVSNYICSPPSQPDGNYRPVPAWAYFYVDNPSSGLGK